MSAIISQNGNAYVEGFSDQWGPWEAYWHDPSPANRAACRPSLSPETIRNWQYGTGADPERLSPDGYELDIAYMARPGAEEIQLDLIRDYRKNVALYPDFQAYFRDHQPPLLAACPSHSTPPSTALFRGTVSSQLLGGCDAPETLRYKVNSDVRGALMLDSLLGIVRILRTSMRTAHQAG